MQNSTISGFPDPRHPAGSQGGEISKAFYATFRPCFRVAVASPHLYLLGHARTYTETAFRNRNL